MQARTGNLKNFWFSFGNCITSQSDFNFLKLEGFENKEVCSKTLKPEEIDHFRSAIEDHYYFELVLGMICLVVLLKCYCWVIVNATFESQSPPHLCFWSWSFEWSSSYLKTKSSIY